MPLSTVPPRTLRFSHFTLAAETGGSCVGRNAEPALRPHSAFDDHSWSIPRVAPTAAFWRIPSVHGINLEVALRVEGGRTLSDLRSSQKGGKCAYGVASGTIGVRSKAAIPLRGEIGFDTRGGPRALSRRPTAIAQRLFARDGHHAV